MCGWQNFSGHKKCIFRHYVLYKRKRKKNVLRPLLRATTMDNRNLRPTAIIINRLTWLCGETFFFAFIPRNNNNDSSLADCPCSGLNGKSNRVKAVGNKCKLYAASRYSRLLRASRCRRNARSKGDFVGWWAVLGKTLFQSMNTHEKRCSEYLFEHHTKSICNT